MGPSSLLGAIIADFDERRTAGGLLVSKPEQSPKQKVALSGLSLRFLLQVRLTAYAPLRLPLAAELFASCRPA
jgi:hypothetical protein